MSLLNNKQGNEVKKTTPNYSASTGGVLLSAYLQCELGLVKGVDYKQICSKYDRDSNEMKVSVAISRTSWDDRKMRVKKVLKRLTSIMHYELLDVERRDCCRTTFNGGDAVVLDIEWVRI